MKNRGLTDYLFILEAWFLLHFGKLAISCLPFKKIASWMGKLNVESTFDVRKSGVILKVEHSIWKASKYTLHQSKCYDQALAAKAMLGQSRLPATIYFGLAKNKENQLQAHAWVRCGNRIVTGKASMSRFTVVACFGDE